MKNLKLLYATKSEFKRAEIRESLKMIRLNDRLHDVPASDIFDVEFPSISTNEPLERDLSIMVRQKALSAYRGILAPCVVEHAGIVLPGLRDSNYPAGLTQPMFDALEPGEFVKSLAWAGTAAIARAVVGYCDGFRVHVFTGETPGQLLSEPRGNREFYWDTVFVPDDGDGRTYAEIAMDDLPAKMKISQSRKAFEACIRYIYTNEPELFRS